MRDQQRAERVVRLPAVKPKQLTSRKRALDNRLRALRRWPNSATSDVPTWQPAGRVRNTASSKGLSRVTMALGLAARAVPMTKSSLGSGTMRGIATGLTTAVSDA